MSTLNSNKDPMNNNTSATEPAGTDSKPSQASRLVALARARYDFFMSEDGRPYGVVHKGANIVLPLRGRSGLRSQLARVFTNETNGAVPSQSALADAMTVLEGEAASTAPRAPQLRVGLHGDDIVVDLGTSDGRCVIVGSGGWHTASRAPVLFRRSGAMSPLPDPIRDGDGLAKLKALLNVDEKDFHLLVAWLLAAFMPSLPHPILTFRGEQGTGKSYAAKAVIGIIDPSGAPKRTAPRDIKSWATQAFNSWALCLDNVSAIPDWLSDALCRAVTGDGIVDRALYTDDDVVVLEFRRVLALTTIDAGALAGDLAERLLTIELSLIKESKRREEQELDRAYKDAHAAILASLFDLLADVLKVMPDVELKERPRMADFARVLAAVDHVMGWRTSETYRATARDAVSDVLDGDPFANAVIELVKAKAKVELTATQLLAEIKVPEKVPAKWPKNAIQASGTLRRLAPALRTVGITLDDSNRQTTGNRTKLFTMEWTGDTESEGKGKSPPASPASPATTSHLGILAGDGAGDGTVPGDAITRTPGDAGDTASASPAPSPAEKASSEGTSGDAGEPGDDLRLLSAEETPAPPPGATWCECGGVIFKAASPLCARCIAESVDAA